MMRRMMRNWMIRALAPAFVLIATATALADDAQPDARWMGYANPMAPPAGSTSLQWLALVGLGVVGLGVMFMNAKRTHLD
jgi:hypothetical protein